MLTNNCIKKALDSRDLESNDQVLAVYFEAVEAIYAEEDTPHLVRKAFIDQGYSDVVLDECFEQYNSMDNEE